MRRVAFTLLGLVAIGLTGCTGFSWKDPNKFYTYCDDTGCYCCDRDGCNACDPNNPPGGGGPDGGIVPPDHPECTTNSDCNPGCYCSPTWSATTGQQSGGTCVEAGFCDTTADCPVGYVCDNRSSCIPGAGGSSCNINSDCATGQVCTNHECVQGGGNPDGGVPDSGGPDNGGNPDGGVADGGGSGGPDACLTGCGQVTVDPARACQFNSECNGGLCINGECHFNCTDSSQCGTGRACTNGHCEVAPAPTPAECVFNSDCTNGTCINGRCFANCSSDADCPNPADACVVGICRADVGRVPQCTANAECLAGQECINGQCKYPCFTAADCANCVGSPVCHAGFCMSETEASPQCKLAIDCGATQSCVNATCTTN